jgi:heme-degrading monooxygenase HmoA
MSPPSPGAVALSRRNLRQHRLYRNRVGPYNAVMDSAMAAHHLAQVNLATLRAPLDGPELAGFVAQLEPINALADRSPGFVWRLQTEDGDATAIRVFDDQRIIVNLSVWESLESLRDFVYASRHLEVMRHRRAWFHRMADAYLALWWVQAGTVPTAAEARRRLELLARQGPGPDVFTFRVPFPAPAAAER